MTLPVLTNSDLVELAAFRHALHRQPELSGEEAATARTIAAALAESAPDRMVTGLGGHGVAAVYDSGMPGPTVLFRAELDALPIEELSDIPHRSAQPGKGHLCGHDGHMTILTGLARAIARRRPGRGRAVLMFQPAEEDGSGARAVTADPRYAGIAPDWAFSLHNMPGVAIGHALLAPGPVNCASMGLRIVLRGKTSHASVPERGLSPATAIAQLIPALSDLGKEGAIGPGFRLATITHARLGEPAFGISPGEAELWVTLRAVLDADMDALVAGAEALAKRVAEAEGLALEMTHHDRFLASVNDAQATVLMARALEAEGIAHEPGDLPMRGSEDFGVFGHGARSAMVFLGSGANQPMLHNPDFDFPDALIEPGVRLFNRLLRDILG